MATSAMTFQDMQAGPKGIVKLFAVVSIGASGAPTLQKFAPASGGGNDYSSASTGGWQGIRSFTKTGTGVYLVTFAQAFPRLLGCTMTVGSVSAGAAPNVAVSNSNITNGTTPTIEITVSTGGVATNPANGEFLIFEFTLQNSTAI